MTFHVNWLLLMQTSQVKCHFIFSKKKKKIALLSPANLLGALRVNVCLFVFNQMTRG